MKRQFPTKRTPYEQELWWRKARMYAIWVLTSIVCLIVSMYTFDAQFFESVDPQIKRAYVKITKLLPDYEFNEESLNTTYELFLKSREELEEYGVVMSGDYMTKDEERLRGLQSEYTLEWITQLSVGNHGSVAVVSKENGEILAHSDETLVGKTMMAAPITSGSPVGVNVSMYKGADDFALEEFGNDTTAREIKLKHVVLFPSEAGLTGFFKALDGVLYGSIVTYEDVYIVCGINAWEYAFYMARALYIDLIVCVLLWLVVRYISLVLDRHEEEASALRTRLTACTVLMALAVFGVSWYVQVLGNVTTSLNSVRYYANAAVKNIEDYEETHKRIDTWLDEQYLIQCRVACDYVNTVGVENVTREDLAKLSEQLGVKHVYVYDEKGQVVVTNSPYDHFRLSDDPQKSSYAFRSLLEGADYVIQPPLPDEVAGVSTQFIGVSRRNDQDMADGFVQVAIDPELREYLTGNLNVDNVLTNITVGQPELALAFDKVDLTVVSATDPNYIGLSINDFGYTEDKLKTNDSGFLYYGYETFCAGFAEAGTCYVVPISHYTGDASASTLSTRIFLITLAGLVLIMVAALYKYQSRVVDAAPSEDEPTEGAAQKVKAMTQGAIDFLGITQVVKVQKKAGFDERWNMVDVEKEKTPERRIFVTACKLLFVFCLLHLLPLMYGGFYQAEDGLQLTGLFYVLTGDWEKGVNIFAFTSCLILLFALYVFMTCANRMLYAIAKVSSLRTETVCLLLKSSLIYFCVVAFIYYGLSQFGIPTQALLASVGIITLAVSVGAKDLVNDIIAGFFILVEGDLKVGDRINVGGWTGTVQEIGLRTTKITHTNETKYCNNSSLRDVVSIVKGVWVRDRFPISIDADLAKVEAILKKELPHLVDDVPTVLSDPVYEGVFSIDSAQVVLAIGYRVMNDKLEISGLEVRRRVQMLMDRYGIPQSTYQKLPLQKYPLGDPFMDCAEEPVENDGKDADEGHEGTAEPEA